MKTFFITGAAGFIGSNLTDRLLANGYRVVGFDNFSTGQENFLVTASGHTNFNLIRGDTLNLPALTAAMVGCDFVFHLAANADVRFGLEHPKKDLEQNTIARPPLFRRPKQRHFRSKLRSTVPPSSLAKVSFKPTAKASVSPVTSSGSSQFLANATRTDMFLIFTGNSANIPTDSGFSATARNVSRTFTSKIASMPCCTSSTKVLPPVRRTVSPFLTWGPTTIAGSRIRSAGSALRSS